MRLCLKHHEYLLTINENPIAAAHPEEVARFVLERLSATQYIPCKWTRIGGDPSLQVGDIVTVVDNKTAFDEAKAEEYDRYPLYLSAQSWTFNCGGFSDVYTSAGNAEKDLNTDKGMTVSKRLSQLAKRITEAKKELTYEMDERQKALLLFNETIAGSMGLYTTYKQQEDGAYICYMHDEPELEESQTIYTFGASGFAWTTSGWNDGSPLWQYGFDRDGNAILNAIFAYKLTADVITSGLLKSKNGASYINMDDGTFCFRAIKEAWMDTDTGEMSYEYQTVLELADKVLNVFGTLRSTQTVFWAILGGLTNITAFLFPVLLWFLEFSPESKTENFPQWITALEHVSGICFSVCVSNALLKIGKKIHSRKQRNKLLKK